MQSEKEKVALGSIAASAGLTLAKGVVGALSGSLAEGRPSRPPGVAGGHRRPISWGGRAGAHRTPAGP